jgi:hypothetical protein
MADHKFLCIAADVHPAQMITVPTISNGAILLLPTPPSQHRLMRRAQPGMRANYHHPLSQALPTSALPSPCLSPTLPSPPPSPKLPPSTRWRPHRPKNSKRKTPTQPFRTELVEDEEGYSPDHDEMALDSDNEDDYESESSSDSDGGLVMRRRRSGGGKQLHHSNSSSSPRTGSLAAALEAAHSKQRRGTGLSRGSKRSSRSGSNNTMKKVRTRDSEDERGREDIQEE